MHYISHSRQDSNSLARFLAGLSAGLKLSALFIISLAAFLSSNLLFLSGLVLAALAFCMAVGIGIKAIFRQLWVFAFLALLLTLFQFFNLNFYEAVAAGLRLFAISAFAVFISSTISAAAFLAATEHALSHFTFLGVNPHKSALALALTLRFVPLLQETYSELRIAQKLRGAEKLRFKEQIQLIGLILIRLIVIQENIAQAIEARSFDTEK